MKLQFTHLPTTSTKKKLASLLKRLFPKATLTKHQYGVVLTPPDAPGQLVVCEAGNLRPFHLEVVRETWDAIWLAAARLGVGLAYAVPDESGLSLLLLPLSAADAREPGWPPVVESKVYDEEADEWVHTEVRRIPLAIGNRVSLPEGKWSEYELQCACIAWARAERPDLVVWSNATEACYKKWRHYELSGVTRGTPDLTCVLPGGRVLLVELKRPSGVLSEAQVELGARITGCGVGYHVVRSVGQFQALLAASTPSSHAG